MAFMTADDGTRLFYRLEGPDGAPPIILSNSLGTDHMMWQPQVEALSHAFRVVRYDQRGHGASDVPTGPYSIERLGLDVLALADHLDLERFSFCGISMGGLTGQWLALHQPARLDRLVLAATAAHIPPREAWEQRIATVGEKGMAGIADVAIDRWNATHLTTLLMGDGFEVKPFGQGFASMSAPTRELERLLKGRKLASSITALTSPSKRMGSTMMLRGGASPRPDVIWM